MNPIPLYTTVIKGTPKSIINCVYSAYTTQCGIIRSQSFRDMLRDNLCVTRKHLIIAIINTQIDRLTSAENKI